MEKTNNVIELPLWSKGQLVHHKKFNYRGVIAEVDRKFGGTNEWYEHVALSRPPKDKPWYHVLVDRAAHMTYVAERHLEKDYELIPIENPMLWEHFTMFEQGKYIRIDN